jgi:hypothetical protein
MGEQGLLCTFSYEKAPLVGPLKYVKYIFREECFNW